MRLPPVVVRVLGAALVLVAVGERPSDLPEEAAEPFEDATHLLHVRAAEILAPSSRENDGGHLKSFTDQVSVHRRSTAMKAYYVNVNSSVERAQCMDQQISTLQLNLKRRDVELSFERFPAMSFTTCTDVESCMVERPECFPVKAVGRITHPLVQDDVKSMRGVLANYCSHLLLLSKLQQEAEAFSYFLIFEDDAIVDLSSLPDSLHRVISTSYHHWPLIALDTFDVQREGQPPDFVAPEEDRIAGNLPLYTISHAWGYWGAHAWMLDSHRLDAFCQFFRSLPAIPLDWVPKVKHPLHLGMMSYSSHHVHQRKHLEDTNVSISCRAISGSDINPRNTLLSEDEGEDEDEDPVNEVVVLGMYDTGTNLIYHLMHDNIEKPNHVELCKNYSGWAYCGRVWKHTHPHRFAEVSSLRARFGLPDLKQAMAVVMVRHPFSLIRSFQKAPYDLACSGNLSLSQPCEYVELSGKALENQEGNVRLRKPICSMPERRHCWKSMVSAWVEYMKGYLTLQHFFKKVIFLRYEDLVQEPYMALRELAAHASQPLMKKDDLDWTWLNRPAKVGGGAGGNENALRKLMSSEYETNFTKEEQAEICSQLNRPILARFGYSGCEDRHKDHVYSEVTVDHRPRAHS